MVAHEALDALHRQFAGAGLGGSQVLGQSAGAVPVEGLREKLALGNKHPFRRGDAGGVAHPLTGAGIHPAVVSGEAAGLAAAEWSVGHLGAPGPNDDARAAAGGWSVVRGAFEA